MQTVIWSFGALVLLMLLLAVLPIGLSWKGKISVGLAAFILALGCLAALTSFAMWQAGLMVFLLVLITAYFMDNRLGAVLYPPIQESFAAEEKENLETVIPIRKETMSTEAEILDLAKVESVIQANSNIEVDDDQQSILEQVILLEKDSVDEPGEDDLQLLLQEKTETDEIIAESETELGYLSEIENLLIEESEGNSDEDNDKPKVSVELLDEDNYLEELFDAMTEAAAGNVDNQKDKNSKEKKKVELY
jgi:membrane protein implicated in regulation of membrane protease activity